MEEYSVMNHITNLFSFLRTHIELYTKTSLNDISFSLETLIMDLLNKLDGEGSWQNANVNTTNYPAIDLINIKDGHAIQVTVNADSSKTKHTIEQYEKQQFNLDKITILGFVHHTKYKRDNAQTVGIEYITKRIKVCSQDKKEEILELIRKSIPLQILSPLSDSDCFDIILSRLDRSALRDNRYCEGSYEDMVRGLKETKELITTGSTQGLEIRIKPIWGYVQPLQEELSEIEYAISDIIRICNKSNREGLVYLSQNQTIKIDQLKNSIIHRTNEISKRLNKDRRIKR